MCILLYVKHIQCSCIPEIYGELEEGDLGICAFCYRLNLFNEVVFHRSVVNLKRRALVYVNSAIC